MSAVSLPATGDFQDCLIQGRDLVRSFGQTPALRGASLSVAAGEILAIMGPSGSGKSTLLHCLAGILTPDSGEVWFAGRRVDTMSEADRSALRRDQFGFVFSGLILALFVTRRRRSHHHDQRQSRDTERR